MSRDVPHGMKPMKMSWSYQVRAPSIQVVKVVFRMPHVIVRYSDKKHTFHDALDVMTDALWKIGILAEGGGSETRVSFNALEWDLQDVIDVMQAACDAAGVEVLVVVDFNRVGLRAIISQMDDGWGKLVGRERMLCKLMHELMLLNTIWGQGQESRTKIRLARSIGNTLDDVDLQDLSNLILYKESRMRMSHALMHVINNQSCVPPWLRALSQGKKTASLLARGAQERARSAC